MVVWKFGCLFTWNHFLVILEFISSKNVDEYKKDDLPIVFEKTKKSALLMRISKFPLLSPPDSHVDDKNMDNNDDHDVDTAVDSSEPISVQQLIEDCILKVTFCYYSNLQLSRLPYPTDTTKNSSPTKQAKPDKSKRASLYSDTSVTPLGQHRVK